MREAEQILKIKDDSKTTMVPIGFDEHSAAFKGRQICRVILKAPIEAKAGEPKFILEFSSLDFPNKPIWKAICVEYPSKWVVDCVHGKSLSSEKIVPLIQETLEKIYSIAKDTQIGVMILEPESIDKVQLLDGDIGSLVTGTLDDLGRLQGYAEIENVETRFDKGGKISGIFRNHHFISGKILTHFTGYLIEFIIHSDPNKTMDVVMSRPGETTEQIVYTMALDRFGDHAFKVPTALTLADVKWLGIQANNIKSKEYHGFTKDLKLHGQGKEICVRYEDGGIVTVVSQGEYQDNVLMRHGTVEAKLVKGTKRILSKVTFEICENICSYSAREEKTIIGYSGDMHHIKTGIFNGVYFVKGVFERLFKRDGSDFRFITQGSFNTNEDIHSTNAEDVCELRCYIDGSLFEQRKGVFIQGEFVKGCMIKHLESGKIEEKYGNFVSVPDNPTTLVGLETIDMRSRSVFSCHLNDAEGVRLVYSPQASKRVEFCKGNFKLDVTSNPTYILEFETKNDKEQLKTVTLPGNWKVAYVNGNCHFELLLQKKQDKKALEGLKNQAITTCNDIENSLILINVLPPQSMVSVIEEDEKERKQARLTKKEQKEAAEKAKKAKQASEDQKRAELERRKKEKLAEEQRQKEARRIKQLEHEAFLLKKYEKEEAAAVSEKNADRNSAKKKKIVPQNKKMQAVAKVTSENDISRLGEEEISSVAGITPDHPKGENQIIKREIDGLEPSIVEVDVTLAFDPERLLSCNVLFFQPPCPLSQEEKVRVSPPLPI